MKILSLKAMYTVMSYVLCLMGCVYQTYKISELYFGYQTTTNVRYDKSTNGTISYPAFTICVEKVNLVNRSLVQNISGKHINEYLNRFNIKQQFESLLSLQTVFNFTFLDEYDQDNIINFDFSI